MKENVKPVEDIFLEGGWKEFIEICKSDSKDKFIYRGQSNEIDKGALVSWGLISSFNRRYKSHGSYNFNKFVSQQLDSGLFNIKYGNYEHDYIEKLNAFTLPSKCYFLQHYGVPTCFMDFTFNPLVALYFAISGIEGSSGNQYDVEGNSIRFDNSYCLSVYQINHELLKKYLGVLDFENENFLNLDRYKIRLHPSINSFSCSNIALDLFPKNRVEENYNLVNQKGCFILYDNRDTASLTLEKFIEDYVTNWQIELEEPIIKIFKITYNSIYRKHGHRLEDISLFSFLKSNKVYGRFLFDDIQGLKHDMNYFHED